MRLNFASSMIPSVTAASRNKEEIRTFRALRYAELFDVEVVTSLALRDNEEAVTVADRAGPEPAFGAGTRRGIAVGESPAEDTCLSFNGSATDCNPFSETSSCNSRRAASGSDISA